MAVQGAVDAIVAFKKETTFGTAAGASGAQIMRRVTSSLGLRKGSFASREVRSDQQISDMRHGSRSGAGGVSSELAVTPTGITFEPLLEGLFRSAFVAGVTVAPADFGTGVTVATSGQNTTFTFAGAGSLITKGVKVGDVVRFTGTTNAALSGKNLRVIGVTATVLSVAGVLGTQAQQAAGWSMAVQGKKLAFGTTKQSFTIEQRFADAAAYELFTGMRVNGASINVPPGGMATIDFDFLGQNGVPAGTPYFTSPTVETVGGNISGMDGAIRVAGQELGTVTGLQLNIQGNHSAPPVIGTNISPEIFGGQLVVTGSVSVMLAGLVELQAFDQETEVDIVALVECAGADPQDFLSFNIQRAKFSAADKQVGGDGAVVIQLPFQALLATGTVRDATTMVIQKSPTT